MSKGKKMAAGFALVIIALCIVTVMAITSFQAKKGGGSSSADPGHSAKGRDTEFGSLAGKCFAAKDRKGAKYYFYDKKNVVISDWGMTQLGEEFPSRSLYEYSVGKDALHLKNEGMAYDCHMEIGKDFITIEGEKYTLTKENMDGDEVIGKRYRQGVQEYYFLDNDTVLVSIDDGETPTESWAYQINGEEILFVYWPGTEKVWNFKIVDDGLMIHHVLWKEVK